MSSGCPRTLLFPVLSGVLQGGPLSGSLCALAARPFCADMERAAGSAGKGVGRWCADDAEAAVCGKPGFEVLTRIFK
eukprot:5601558-Pyramimonas_sp.AAC.1